MTRTGSVVATVKLNVFDRHQLKIARDTLNMTDAGAMIMGGMTKDEARKIIDRLTNRAAFRGYKGQ